MAEGSFLLPVELPHANHAASTNNRRFYALTWRALYNRSPMPAPSSIDQVTERVERLLRQHEQLRRTNALLAQQVMALTQERDSLKSRLQAARARVDALLDRLPANQNSSDDTA